MLVIFFNKFILKGIKMIYIKGVKDGEYKKLKLFSINFN